ncbi:hypothetical protein HS088_TW09G00874 [Tripterygium wilfordii]|uniref:RING-type domain-containing protein n=1 Tax=Tripterygium wilfordii TaxID=458696 RepID=A0A7J7D940_TRIWF|nr:probable E3 ubiquitin-protein ligase EDA40 [Tripterygium wilfordii]KAF5742814.1 hypothetical protein HS088_TW09G00874 [Tripterygium wilfordii]
MGVGVASSKLKKAAWKMVVTACGSFSMKTPPPVDPVAIDPTILGSSSESPPLSRNVSEEEEDAERVSTPTSITNNSKPNSKNLCAICLDPLRYSSGGRPGQAIFTAQCSHAFHFECISSNVRHGSITCPICRAHWTQLPRNLNPPCNQSDPIFQILDDSIATFRVHRRSLLRSARYDDDDPIETDHTATASHSRLDLFLTPVAPTLGQPYSFHHPNCLHSSLQLNGMRNSHYHHQKHHQTPFLHPASSRRPASLSVKLAHQPATDLVVVASTNGPHLRLLKQSMALVVFSLRTIDRLAIVTYSSSAARVFPLRRMTSCGKRAALQVIDRLFYMGQADPDEGLKKGIKILEHRSHKNPHSCVLHLSDSPTRSYHGMSMQLPIPIHRFHVGFGFGTSNGFVMHEFEDFLARVLGGVIRDVQLRIIEEQRIIRLGELKGDEERRIYLEMGERGQVHVEYSYVEGGDDFITTGETVVSIGNKREAKGAGSEAVSARDVNVIGGRNSSVETWDYHHPHMARRWAKHLHGYRI